MSDEESFVILGTTPTPSMEAYSSLSSNVSRPGLSAVADKLLVNNISESCGSEASWLKNSDESVVKHERSESCVEAGEAAAKQSIGAELPLAELAPDVLPSAANLPSVVANIVDDATCPLAVPESLADKYLLGKIDKNEMKMFMSNTFPSLFGKEPHQEDVQKLQQLLIDHELYKNQIMKINTKLEHFIDVIQVGDEQRKIEIEKLREEKDTMQREMASEIEAIKLNEQQLQKEYYDLLQNVSEGKSVMSSIGVQLERLELQQHDMSIINVNPLPDQTIGYIPMKPDAASKKIKDLERELSKVIAENYEMKDMKKIYIDEIDCLKVNLTAAEELLGKAQTDINYLKSKDIENTEKFTKYEAERDAMKQEIGILKHQLEVYRSDFEIERSARQELAGERDQTLTDLKLMQRRNQQLMEDYDRLKNPPSRTTPSYAVPPRQSPSPQQSFTTTNFVCPICSKTFRSLAPLEIHVQNCLSN